MTDLGLDAYVSELRRELLKANQSADGKDLGFELGPVEVTLAVKVVKSTDPSVKFRLAVVDIGAGASFAKEDTQTVKLTLTPVYKGERKFYIDGEASENER